MSAEELRNAATAQHWATEGFRALSLDSMWTQILGRRYLDPPEASEAANIGESLNDAWLRLTAGDTLGRQYRYVTVHGDRRGEPVSQFDKALRDFGGPFRLAHAAFGQLEERREVEAGRLAEKVETLRQGEWTPGDLSPTARCALLAAVTLTVYALGDLTLSGGLLSVFVSGGCAKLLIGDPHGDE
ncbi:hypothetical protein RM572_00495 [Streptomyces sp. DSM 42041]|uniref:Uncharacterized protein n=1 Tax=Streptomyces hazeniae TaxID=3075538 RepID=A0ABU2NKJ1_9ACTN|nr:hypothetical protein [Streptomyces sp. DSM 42041]MDT0377254.1 hypothetical protein [Streptomyces sp. DSM 42041]